MLKSSPLLPHHSNRFSRDFYSATFDILIVYVICGVFDLFDIIWHHFIAHMQVSG